MSQILVNSTMLTAIRNTKKLLLWLVTLLACWSCAHKQADHTTLAGDLYFGSFRIGSYYNQPDSVTQYYETYFDTASVDTTDKNEGKLLKLYHTIKDKDLLYKPFVDLLVQKDSVVRLYLDQRDYDKIKIHKRKELQATGKKVSIESDVRLIDSGLYYCVALKKVAVVEGETLQRERKFKIEDYN